MIGNGKVPVLDNKKLGFEHEGPTDYRIYAKPLGRVRAVMVFVRFPDAAPTGEPMEVAGNLLGEGRAQQLFHQQSFGRMSLEVDVRWDLGWRMMPRPSSEYSFKSADPHREYVRDASALFRAHEVRFSDYAMVFVVAPKTAANFPLSPAFRMPKGYGAKSPSGEIRLAVTFGRDSYANRYVNLVHEVGHLFGLPDLYPYAGGGAAASPMGCWPIMSDIFHSVSFIGWHRHKNGWIDKRRMHYLSRNRTERLLLSPMWDPLGLAMIVVPADRQKRPSRVFVVEQAQPVLGTDGTVHGGGVLLYVVDATVPGGASPMRLVPKQVSTSPVYGHLWEAPYGEGDTVSHVVGDSMLTLKVLETLGAANHVQVTHRQP